MGQVENDLDALCINWGIQVGKTNLGELRNNKEFQDKVGQLWMDWENQTNLWWTEICEKKKKEAGGGLKG